MRRTCIFLLFAIFMCCPLFAVNYFGEKFWLRQPNGTKVEVCVFGNEFYQDVETPDGYTLIRDERNGEICYALPSSDRLEYASSGIAYNGGNTPAAVKKLTKPHARISSYSIKKKTREAKEKFGFKEKESDHIQLRTATVLPDTIYGIVILVDFQDVKSDITKEQVENYCNADNYNEFGNNRSIKEYYQWISGGKITYINYVTDYITMPKNKSEYDNDNIDLFGDGHGFGLLDTISNVILSEKYIKRNQLTKISSSYGSNYSVVNIFYAGSPECGWSKGLWPHMASQGVTTDPLKKYENPYQMTNIGNELTIGTFVHETAHLVCGWPDFYSYDGLEVNNNVYGLGTQWISSKTKKPLAPSPYCLDLMGWVKKQDITNLKNGELVTLHDQVGDVAVYYETNENGRGQERYYIEVRNKQTPEYIYEKELNGIFIWHINETADNQYPMYTNGLQMEDCRPATFDDPCFKKGLKSEFNDVGSPSARWDNGSNSGLDIWDISEAGAKMTFRCGRELESIQNLSISKTKGVLKAPFLAQLSSLTHHLQQEELRFRLTNGVLPTGLKLSSNGKIEGIPSETGVFNFTVEAYLPSGMKKSQSMSIEILNFSDFESFNGIINLPDTVEIEDFIKGGEGIGYHDKSTGNGNSDTSSVYRPDENVDIIYNIYNDKLGVIFEKDEWTRYVINVETEGYYKLTVNFDSLYNTRNRNFLILLDEKDTLVNNPYNLTYSLFTIEQQDYNQTHFLVELPQGEHCLTFLARDLMAVDNISFQKTDYQKGVRKPFHGSPINIPGVFNLYDFDYNGIEMDPSYEKSLNNSTCRWYRTDYINDSLFLLPNKMYYTVKVEKTGWYEMGYHYEIYTVDDVLNITLDENPVPTKKTRNSRTYTSILYAYLQEGDWTLSITNTLPLEPKFDIKEFNQIHLESEWFENNVFHLAQMQNVKLTTAFSPYSECSITTRGLGNDSLSSGLPKGMKIMRETELSDNGSYYSDFEKKNPSAFFLVGIPEETGIFEFEVIVSDSVGYTSRDTFRFEVKGVKELDSNILILDQPCALKIPIELKIKLRGLDNDSTSTGLPNGTLLDQILSTRLSEGAYYSNILIGSPQKLGEFRFEYIILNFEDQEIFRDTMSLIVKGPSMPFDKIFQIPCVIPAKDFDLGGEGVAYHLEKPYRGETSDYREEDVPFVTSDNGNLYISMQRKEWYRYSIDVPKDGYYSIKADGEFFFFYINMDKTNDAIDSEIGINMEMGGCIEQSYMYHDYDYVFYLKAGTYRIQIENLVGDNSFSQIEIKEFNLFIPYDQKAVLPGVINVAEFDKGHNSYLDNDCENTGDFRTETPVDILQTDSGKWVKMEEGEWLRYTFSFDENATEVYRVTLPFDFKTLNRKNVIIPVNLLLFYWDQNSQTSVYIPIAYELLKEGKDNSFEITIPNFKELSRNISTNMSIILQLDYGFSGHVLLKEMIFERVENSSPAIAADFFKLYPNPAHDEFEVDIKRKGFSLNIYNSQGIKIEDFKNIKQGKFRFGKNLPTGIYMMQAICDGIVVATEKLIKQ